MTLPADKYQEAFKNPTETAKNTHNTEYLGVRQLEGVTWLYIYDCSSLHGRRKRTNYGSIERACLALTNSGGCKILAFAL